MSPIPPILQKRARAELLADWLARQPGYVPDLKPRAGAAEDALGRIFSRYIEIYSEGLNAVPGRSLLAFFSKTGASLLPAQPARAALVFKLMPNAPADVSLPANSQVAAPAQPRPVSPLFEDELPPPDPQAQIFATTQAITLTRAALGAVFSVDPGQDVYADHTARLDSGFAFFDRLGPVEHTLYLGHDEAFALAGEAEIHIAVALGAFGLQNQLRGLKLDWEYLSKDGWLPLTLVKDLTAGLTSGGEIFLSKDCGPDSKQDTINGCTSYWIRALLRTPLLPQGTANLGELPVLDTLQMRVGFTKSGLEPEAAFSNQTTLDTGNNFLPLGLQPARYTTFYIASKEAFQRRSARIGLSFTFSEPGQSSNAALTWEYFNGNNWSLVDARYDLVDNTKNFTRSGTVNFIAPLDWRETEVNGTKNFWLRARLDGGDYGQPMRLNVVPDGSSYKVTLADATLHPPVVSRLQIQYTFLTNSALLNYCLTYNNFVFEDHSEDSRWLRRTFMPFVPQPDRFPAVYFSFTQAFPVGLVSLYLDGSAAATLNPTAASGLVWEYATAHGWSELSVLDETSGFRRSGMIQFIGPPDAAASPGLGGNLFRVRARLQQGGRAEVLPVSGLWLNAVWATQRQVFDGEVLGNSTGAARQILTFLRRQGAVLEGERVEVREWVLDGGGEGWQTAVLNVSPEDVRLEVDPVTGLVTAAWVRWSSRPHLYSSGPSDRHYVLERSTGLIHFGDGKRGLIPPAGCRITASYSSGGSLEGNLPGGAIHELRTGAAYLMGVTNPVAASGGAFTEELAVVKKRGAQRLRHLGKALSPQDYEWLAREASPGVARARCLALAGPDGSPEVGWVTLVIVPNSLDPRPVPAPELVRRVAEYVSTHAPACIAAQVRVLPPEFVPVSVEAEVIPLDPGQAAQVEGRVRRSLEQFLHPLKGGLDGRGWDFGAPVHISHISQVIENTPGVDYAARILLRVAATSYMDTVPVGPVALVVSGGHELKLTIGTA